VTRQELKRRHRQLFRDVFVWWGGVAAVEVIGILVSVCWPSGSVPLDGALFSAVMGAYCFLLVAFLAVPAWRFWVGSRKYGLLCPHCGAFMGGQSLRIISACGRCPECGGKILDDSEFAESKAEQSATRSPSAGKSTL